jgi:anti-anti-sigma factor
VGEAEETRHVIDAEASATVRHIGPDCVEIELVGDLDGPAVARLRTAIPLPASAQAVLDLSGVTFMGSSGINWLVGLQRHIDQLLVRNPSPIVRRVLEVTGVAEVLAIVDRPDPDDDAQASPAVAD